MAPHTSNSMLVLLTRLNNFTQSPDSLKRVLEAILKLPSKPCQPKDEPPQDFVLKKPLHIKEYSKSLDEFYLNEVIPDLEQEKLVKKMEKVTPDGILPFPSTLTDRRPNTRDSDEAMYNKHARLRRMLPRGACVMKLSLPDGREIYDCVTYGQKKFSGSTVEDDDDIESVEELAPNKYFLKDPETATRVLAIEKVNGEAAHISGRYINNEFFFIVGSKNVHIIFNKMEHIMKYTEDRYKIANHISIAFLAHWNAISQTQRELFAQFLHLTRVTLVGEMKMLDHQHVVYFEGMKQNSIILFSITPPPPPSEEDNNSFSAVPTIPAFEILNKLGFCTPFFSEMSPGEFEKDKNRVRELRNEEGRVYYYEDMEGNTIGLLKLKTKWYVHLRALRQQATYRHRSSTKNAHKKKTLDEAKERARSRLTEIKTWLNTPDHELEHWKKVGDAWFEFLENRVSVPGITVGEIDANQIRDNFPCVWKPFIEWVQGSVDADTLVSFRELGLLESSYT